MKKVIAIAFAGLFSLGLVACGGSSETEKQEVKELETVATELDSTMEAVQASEAELDAAMDDLLSEFPDEEATEE